MHYHRALFALFACLRPNWGVCPTAPGPDNPDNYRERAGVGVNAPALATRAKALAFRDGTQPHF